VIAGGTEINAHFANPPFQDQELAGNPKAQIVLDSYEVLGGPSSATVLYATEKLSRRTRRPTAPSSTRWSKRRSWPAAIRKRRPTPTCA
jgi:hypothetical protein